MAGLWQRKFGRRISQETVDDTVQRKGELVAAGRFNSQRRISADFDLAGAAILGAGATGKVQLATRIGGPQCAVKSVQKKNLSKSARALLMNEAGLYLSLDHPNVAKLEQVYESGKEIHFVMEHLQGGELLQRLKKVGKFSEEQAAEAMRQMLRSVAYLHAHAIAHRDLKPENFVYETADGDHLKMIDFGFASRFGEDSRMTQSCGSLHYVAPEVLAKSYDEKADLWSMGVIAFTLLCGRSPWHPYKDSRKETLRKVTAGDVFYCPERFGSLSPEAQAFIKALLTVDPKARLSAAQALQHPWIQNLTASNADLDQDLAEKLCKSEHVSPFRKICLSMAAWHLSSAQTEDLRKQFHALDVTNSGALTRKAFEHLVVDDEKLDLESLFAHADLGQDGEVGFNSFVVASMDQRPHEDVLRSLFNRLDSDKNGAITARDLKKALGPTFEGCAMRELIKEADFTGNGAISFEEFRAFLMKEEFDADLEDGDTKACFLKTSFNKARSLVGRAGQATDNRLDGMVEANEEGGSRGLAKLFLRWPARAATV